MSGDISKSFNTAASGSAQEQSTSQDIASKQRIEDLERQLSEPTLIYEWTPTGTVAREIRTENDQKIIQEVARHREQLGKQQSRARDDFNMAHTGWMDDHLAPYEAQRKGRKP